MYNKIKFPNLYVIDFLKNYSTDFYNINAELSFLLFVSLSCLNCCADFDERCRGRETLNMVIGIFTGKTY